MTKSYTQSLGLSDFVAQLAEQLTLNQRVESSNLSGVTRSDCKHIARVLINQSAIKLHKSRTNKSHTLAGQAANLYYFPLTKY
jgi:hypothetical protein